MKKWLLQSGFVVLAVCLEVRMADAMIAPLLPTLLGLTFAGGLMLWVIGRR